MRRHAIALVACCGVLTVSAQKDPAIEEAQLNAKMVLVMARTVQTQTGKFDAMTVEAVKKRHADLKVVADGPATDPETVGIKVMGHLRIVSYAGGFCWGIREPLPAERLPSLYAKRKSKPGDCKASSFSDADFREHAQAWGR